MKDSLISRHLHVNIKTVRKWKKRADIDDKPHTGRPAIHQSPRTVESITELCRDKWNASIRKAACVLNNSHDFIQNERTISATTIARIVRSFDWGRVAYKPRVAPMMSDKNVQDRLRFAQQVQRAGYCGNIQLSRVLLDCLFFTDESSVELHPRPNKQNTRIRTSNPELRTPIMVPKHGVKIMIAGGLSAEGLTCLHICDPNTTITGAYYRERILPQYFSAISRTVDDGPIDQRRLFQHPNSIVFMQDGAPAHTAKATLDLLAGVFSEVWTKGTWPGNSPDLNLIEHIWADIQESIFREPRPRNRAGLIERVQTAWKAISREHCQRLVYSFASRIGQCIEREGKSTDY
jgi:hypothetical protein